MQGSRRLLSDKRAPTQDADQYLSAVDAARIHS